MAPNPFVFDRPVAPIDLIDRVTEVEALVGRLEDGTNSRLSSPRRYGKTSLLRRVLEDCEALGMGSVYVDLFGARTVEQVHARIERSYEAELRGVLARALSALRRAGGAGVTTPVGGATLPAAGGPTERALLDVLDLPRRLKAKTGIRIAVAFDEFQEVLGAGQAVDGLIRSVIQHHGEAATYVFAGSHPGLMAELFGNRTRPFYGQAAPLVLGPLPLEELADFIAGRFERTGRDAGPALGWLLGLADGHPQRAMLLAHLLWAEVEAGGAGDEDAWGRVIDGVEAYVRDEFEATWSALTPVERGVAEAVASGGASLTTAATMQRFGLTKGGAPPAAARLLASGALVEDPGRPTGFRLVDPLFARWVANDRRWG